MAPAVSSDQIVKWTSTVLKGNTKYKNFITMSSKTSGIGHKTHFGGKAEFYTVISVKQDADPPAGRKKSICPLKTEGERNKVQ